MNDDPNYRLLLARTLEEKRKHNPNYSLRALARSFRISPASLSQIISGKRRLSKQAALRIAHAPGSTTELKNAMLLMSQQKTPGLNQTEQAGQNLSQTLEVETFKMISNWYHFAILSMSAFKKKFSDPSWIGSKLNISPKIAGGALMRLHKLGLIHISGNTFRQMTPRVTTTNDIPDKAIRLFHHQMIEKAAISLDQDHVSFREFGCETLAIHPDQLPELKDELRKFRDHISEISKQHPDKKRLYALNLQLFPIDHENGDFT